jgi:hypothetical protein
MISKIIIDFETINGFTVDKNLSGNKQLRASTQKTTDILCEQILKYFKDHKIKVKVTNELI